MTNTADTFHDEFHQIDDPESSSTWFVTLTGTIVFIALVLGLAVMYFQADNRVVVQREIDVPVKALADLKAGQIRLLSDYAYYEEMQTDGKTTVARLRIPIERAMEGVASQLASNPKVAAGGNGE